MNTLYWVENRHLLTLLTNILVNLNMTPLFNKIVENTHVSDSLLPSSDSNSQTKINQPIMRVTTAWLRGVRSSIPLTNSVCPVVNIIST